METLFICIEVFLARLLEVSIGSARMIYLVKQKNIIACILAFIEIIIWFYVARQTLTSSEVNILIVMSYASGYAIGTYVGGLINKYLVKGNLTAMVITSDDKRNIVDILKDAKYGVSIINLEDNKIMLLIELNKKNLKKFNDLVHNIDRSAFVIINETLHVENGYIN